MQHCATQVSIRRFRWELSLLRSVILESLLAFPRSDATHHRRTHRFLDEVVRVSTVRFAEHKQEALQTLSASRLGLLRTVSHEVRNAVNSTHLVREVQRKLPNTPTEARLDAALESVESELTSLRQVSCNFISNALEYTQEGSVTLRMADHSEDTWRFEVQDTGMGVSEVLQRHLFQEFFRAPGTEEIHGTGLGLAITKRLVEALGGTIVVTSALGVGSTFAALLPKRR